MQIKEISLELVDFNFFFSLVNSDLLYLEEKPSTEKNYSAPGMKVRENLVHIKLLITNVTDMEMLRKPSFKNNLLFSRWSIFFMTLQGRLYADSHF